MRIHRKSKEINLGNKPNKKNRHRGGSNIFKMKPREIQDQIDNTLNSHTGNI